MNTHHNTMKHITLQVQDQHHTVYQVDLTVNEQAAIGILVILAAGGAVPQRFDLSQIKKGLNGTQLTCTVRGAATTLALHGDTTPPEMRVVATLFVPIFTATYFLSQEEHQRFVQWINALAIDALV